MTEVEDTMHHFPVVWYVVVSFYCPFPYRSKFGEGLKTGYNTLILNLVYFFSRAEQKLGISIQNPLIAYSHCTYIKNLTDKPYR